MSFSLEGIIYLNHLEEQLLDFRVLEIQDWERQIIFGKKPRDWERFLISLGFETVEVASGEKQLWYKREQVCNSEGVPVFVKGPGKELPYPRVASDKESIISFLQKKLKELQQ